MHGVPKFYTTTNKLKTIRFKKKVIWFRRRSWEVWGNTGQRGGLSKCLDNFKNFVVSLIVSLFISKVYNFDTYNNKCKILSLGKFLILRSRF